MFWLRKTSILYSLCGVSDILHGVFIINKLKFYFFTHLIDEGGSITGGDCPLGNQPAMAMRIF